MNLIKKKISYIILFLSLVSIGTSILAPQLAFSQSINSFECQDPRLGMGDRIVCEFRVGMLTATSQLQDIFDNLWGVFMLICAYQIIVTFLKDPFEKWHTNMLAFMTKFVLVIVVAFPNRANLSMNLPYTLYLEIEEFTTGLFITASGARADNTGFGTIMQSYLEIGNMFWDGNDPLKKADLSPAECSDNLGILFPTNAGNTMPTNAQGKCIIELLEHAVANVPSQSATDSYNNIVKNLEEQRGYGGMRIDEAIKLYQASDEGQGTLDVVQKQKLHDFIQMYEKITNRIPLYEKQMAIGSPGITNVFSILQIQIAKFNLFMKENTDVNHIMFMIAVVVLWICILLSLVLIGCAFFLLTFVPLIIVPIGMAIYSMMWIFAVLNGKMRSVLDIYRKYFIPYAIGPGLFILISRFVVAIIKTLPKAILHVDASMPLTGVIIFTGVLTLIISVFAFVILKDIFKWAKAVASINLEPVLDYAMEMSNIMGSIIATAVKGAALLVTGGAAVGVAGVGAASAMGKIKGGNLLQGGYELFRGAFRAGQDGSVGAGRARLRSGPPVQPVQGGAMSTNSNLPPAKNTPPEFPSLPPPPVSTGISAVQLASVFKRDPSKDEIQISLNSRRKDLERELAFSSDESLPVEIAAAKEKRTQGFRLRQDLDSQVRVLSSSLDLAKTTGDESEIKRLTEKLNQKRDERSNAVSIIQEADEKLTALEKSRENRLVIRENIADDEERLNTLKAMEEDVIYRGVLRALQQIQPLKTIGGSEKEQDKENEKHPKEKEKHPEEIKILKEQLAVKRQIRANEKAIRSEKEREKEREQAKSENPFAIISEHFKDLNPVTGMMNQMVKAAKGTAMFIADSADHMISTATPRRSRSGISIATKGALDIKNSPLGLELKKIEARRTQEKRERERGDISDSPLINELKERNKELNDKLGELSEKLGDLKEDLSIDKDVTNSTGGYSTSENEEEFKIKIENESSNINVTHQRKKKHKE